MNISKIDIEFQELSKSYQITITDDPNTRIGTWALDCLGKTTSRIAIISNTTVFELYGNETSSAFRDAGFEVFIWLLKDGEEHKNFKNVQMALDFLAENGFTRTDAVLALGGGVAGDLAGFVSAIYLRGISFLQMPTTFLSMIDSSVGGKTGVNSATGKNRVGCFHQPNGVLIRSDVLATLPPRELTAGLCEAIKHGALSGKTLFNLTSDFISKFPTNEFSSHFSLKSFRSELNKLLAAQVAFKASIVKGDPQELTSRKDKSSRKILNLGHTLAHALETVSNYKYFKHGEAVGYGLIYAAEISKELALIDETVVSSLCNVVHRSGALPLLNGFDPEAVFEAFKFDKKHVDGSLQMVLLNNIGKPRIVTGNNIPRSVHLRVLRKLIRSNK